MIQPNIHPKLRIWQFHTEKSGASGQKCQKGLPPSLSIAKQTDHHKQSPGAPGAAMSPEREGTEVVGRGCFLGSGYCSPLSPLLLVLFLKARAALVFNPKEVGPRSSAGRHGVLVESQEQEQKSLGRDSLRRWGLGILGKLPLSNWVNPHTGCYLGLSWGNFSRLVSGTHPGLWATTRPRALWFAHWEAKVEHLPGRPLPDQ